MFSSVSPERNVASIFQAELMKDEKVLWAAQPEAKLFGAIDLFLIPFGLFSFGLSVFLILGISGLSPSFSKSPPAELLPLVFPIALISLMGAYLLFGRFFYKVWKQKNTYYAVTNQRLLVLCNAPSHSLQTVFINTIPTLTRQVGKDGVGTIVFGNMFPGTNMYVNVGTDFGSFSGALTPAFYNVKNVNSVYELINTQRAK